MSLLFHSNSALKDPVASEFYPLNNAAKFGLPDLASRIWPRFNEPFPLKQKQNLHIDCPLTPVYIFVLLGFCVYFVVGMYYLQRILEASLVLPTAQHLNFKMVRVIFFKSKELLIVKKSSFNGDTWLKIDWDIHSVQNLTQNIKTCLEDLVKRNQLNWLPGPSFLTSSQ